ncbi:unnamed protein product [Gadus morhua 'NCC']
MGDTVEQGGKEIKAVCDSVRISHRRDWRKGKELSAIDSLLWRVDVRLGFCLGFMKYNVLIAPETRHVCGIPEVPAEAAVHPSPASSPELGRNRTQGLSHPHQHPASATPTCTSPTSTTGSLTETPTSKMGLIM